METFAFVPSGIVLTQSMNTINFGMRALINVHITSFAHISGMGAIAVEPIDPVDTNAMRARIFGAIVNVYLAHFS